MDGLSDIEQVSAFHIEVTNWTDEFCAIVEAWLAAHPDPDDEVMGCLYNALETASVRLGGFAQEKIAGR